MPKYEVQVNATATIFVEVEAEDEDEVHNVAKDEAQAAMYSDWDIETRNYLVIMGVTKLGDDD